MVVLVVNTDKNIQDSQLINTLGVPKFREYLCLPTGINPLTANFLQVLVAKSCRV